MSTPITVVVLGASHAGLTVAHELLAAAAKTNPKALKLVLVSPNTHFYWNVASPRGILPDIFPDERLFYPIAAGLAKYGSAVELVLGRAEKLDPAGKKVVVALNDEKGEQQRTVEYDYAIVATGSSAREDVPWKNLDTTEGTRRALEEWRGRIKAAKSIVVAGGGMTGSELAGELGQEYASTGAKEVTLVINEPLPLDDEARADIRTTVVKELERLGVKVLLNRRVTAARDADGVKAIDITDRDGGNKQTLTADVYLPAFGVIPNTGFLPAETLAGDKRVRTTRRLRVEGHDDVYVIGDASDMQTATAIHAGAQAKHVALDIASRVVKGKDEYVDFKPDDSPVFVVTLGRKRGTGQVGTWRLPNLLAWFGKSRNMLTDKIPGHYYK